MESYINWDKSIEQRAVMRSIEYITDYNDGIRFISYKTDQTSIVETYTLMKIWHILNGSGIFMDSKVYKTKETCRVEINFDTAV